MSRSLRFSISERMRPPYQVTDRNYVEQVSREKDAVNHSVPRGSDGMRYILGLDFFSSHNCIPRGEIVFISCSTLSIVRAPLPRHPSLE